jgi:hypothetical protein
VRVIIKIRAGVYKWVLMGYDNDLLSVS